MSKFSQKETSNVTLKECLTHPRYRKATWVALGVVIFHELSGINAILAYSHSMLAKMDKEGDAFIKPKVGTYLVGVTNFLSSVFAIWVVKTFTRRNLLVFGHLLFGLAHLLVGFFAQFQLHTLALIGILLFIFFFATSDGPIGFIYASEVVVDSALGLCYFALIGSILILQLSTKFMMSSWLQPQGVFWLLATISLIASVYCYIWVKDTTHLNDKEKKQLFTPDEYKEGPDEKKVDQA